MKAGEFSGEICTTMVRWSPWLEQGLAVTRCPLNCDFLPREKLTLQWTAHRRCDSKATQRSCVNLFFCGFWLAMTRIGCDRTKGRDGSSLSDPARHDLCHKPAGDINLARSRHGYFWFGFVE